MNNHPNPVYEYTAGGALPVNAATYVKRRADDELFESLRTGHYCYVLNTRQVGKSSLRVRTIARLRAEGILCAEVDLSIVAGSEATKKQWYDAVIRRLASGLGLTPDFNLKDWLHQRSEVSPSERFGEFLESVVLDPNRGRHKVVIFFDEIDSTLNLNFNSDEFFTIIRGCFNRRADQPELNRLAFGLLGVADPGDLIQDKTRTPFNIGKAIELRGFTLEEAQPLALGLVNIAARPTDVLQAILGWTNGQPFLTHKLCLLVNSENAFIPAGEEQSQVARLVQQLIIDNWDAHDDPEHLKTIANRILMSPKQRTSRLLGIYQQLLKEGQLSADNSPEQMELRLSGLMVNQNGWLKVYNPIYEAIFDASWVEHNLARLRPYSESLVAWFASDCKDESRLLRGQALRDAQAWAEGKSLSDSDWHFLTASQNLERCEIEKAYAAEREASQILKAANEEAARKAVHAKRIFTLTAAAALLLAVGTAGFAYQSVLSAKTAEATVKKAATDLNNAVTKLNDAETRAVEAETKTQGAETRLSDIQDKLAVAEAHLDEATKAKQAIMSRAKTAENQAKQALKVSLDGEKLATLKLAEVNSQVKEANDRLEQLRVANEQLTQKSQEFDRLQKENTECKDKLKKFTPN